MKNLTVKDIVKETGAKLIVGNELEECINFSKDTRNIEKGDIYIGIKGASFDGSGFWRQALEKGAKGVIVSGIEFKEEEKEEFKDRIILVVEDTLEALYKIARYKRSLYNIPVIGITGSVGKTSTKDMVASVVSKKYKTLKTIGNNNNNIGLPFTILRLKDEEAMVLEMGMNHLGEISLLTSIAKPTLCVITNIGTSHIGNLGSRQNILKAKLEIIEGCKNPEVIVNNDNDLLHIWQEQNKDKMHIMTYAIKEPSDLNAENIVLKEQSSKYNCKIYEEKVEVNVPVAGDHFILNSLCAVKVGEFLSIETKKILEGIEKFELTQKRMDISENKKGVKIINDAYNANCESMKASLKALSEYKENRKIAVLGDMFELGEFSEELHKKVGSAVQENKIDILVCYGNLAKYIVEQAKKEGMKEENIYYFENKEELLQLLNKITKKGDVVLFKASNAMKFFELAENLIKGN